VAIHVREATAKAPLIDRVACRPPGHRGDVPGANAVLMDAYRKAKRPLLAGLCEKMGLAPDPMSACERSGYVYTIAAERVGGRQAGWSP